MKKSTFRLLISASVVLLILLQVTPRQPVMADGQNNANPRQHVFTGPSNPTGNGVPEEHAPLAPGAISGHVSNSSSIAIENASVTIYTLDFQPYKSKNTSADGAYNITSLPVGSYYVGVQAAGYGGLYYPAAYDNPHALAVQVKSGLNTAGIDFHLSFEAVLSGIVQQQSNAYPIAGAIIQVTPLYGGPTLQAASGGDGLYTVHGIATGYYTASASAAGYEQEFFDNAISAPASDAIQLVQPNNTPDKNFSLAVPTQANPTERNYLVQFFNANNGPSWYNRDNWDSETVNACSWYGVSCHDGHVAALDLDNNNVAGTISPYLWFLPELQVISFQNNQISGSIPINLATLTELRILNLGNNQVSGAIPPLASLSKLKALKLNNNQLGPVIPDTLSNLIELNILLLNNNYFEGSIPNQLGNFGALHELNLADNQLSGSIPPSLGSLYYLTDLDLHDNQLGGTIPAALGNIASLVRLNLQSNQLTGAIPPELGNLADLRELNLSINHLTGSIPAGLAACTKLEKIQLNLNQLSGAIPTGFGSLRSLQRLDLYLNQLTGPLPSPQSGGLANLVKLDLFHNQLTGSIPTGLGNSANLNWLDLGSNQLTGAIPASLGSLVNLQHLYLDNNHFTGVIPTGLGNLTGLVDLLMDRNQLSGSIPPELANLTALNNLFLKINQLTGIVPPELGSLTNLWFLSLNNNQLTGPIPDTLSGLSSLVALRMANNQLSGAIPASLANLSGLKDPGGCWDGGNGLDLDFNALSVLAYGEPLASFLLQKNPNWRLSQQASFTLTAAGGQMVSYDNRAVLDFPADAVVDPTTILFSPQSTPVHPWPVYSFANFAFNVSARDGSGQPRPDLLQPVQITLYYSDADVSGIDESKLLVYYWDAARSAWMNAAATCPGYPGYTRNAAANQLALNVCKFSDFALMAVTHSTYLPDVRRNP